MSSPVRKVLIGLAVVIAACSEEPMLEPNSAPPTDLPLAEPEAAAAPIAPTGSLPAAVTLPACTHRWAAAVNGSWFTAASWSPASVPGAASVACIDAAGTYTVTLDPPNDATPVVVNGLSVGGASGTQTLRIAGPGALVTATAGVEVKASGVLSLDGYNGVVLTAGGLANAGTLQSLGVCGGCGNATVRSDLDNSGTLIAAGNGLILDKQDGIYRNTGTINVVGTLTIPASAGSPSFTLEAGAITSTLSNPSNADFRMLAGSFTYTGGDALKTNRGLVTLEGVDLTFGTSPVGTAAFSMLPSTAGNTFTGNIGATHTLQMPSVGGFPTMTSRTLTLVGDVVNHGTIDIQPTPSSGFPILAGTGSLTNKGTLLSTGTGGDSLRIAIDLRNEGTITSNGRFLQLDQPNKSYVNAGTIDGTGTLRMRGSTLTNEATAHLNITTDLRDASHLRGTGTNTAGVRLFDGSAIDPGFSPGILTVGGLNGIAGGILNFELGGETAGTGYDQIQASGSATISQGILRITAIDGFEAGKCGQVFDIITHNSPGGIGTFASVEGLDQGPGRSLKVLYGKPAIKLVGLDAGKLVGTRTEPVPLAEGGAAGTYYVCLGERPNADVTITQTADAQVTVTPASLTFTPSDWELPKAFTITAVDDQVTEGEHTGRVGHTVTSTDSRFNNFVLGDVTATITDNDTNRNPSAANDQATTAQDTPVEIDVLANDSDPDGDELTITAVTTQASGTAAIIAAGKRVRFTPTTGFSGSASFGYTVSDGKGGSATGSVSVTVTGPIVGDQTWTTAEDTPLTNQNVLGSGPLPSALSVTQPANGTATATSGAGGWVVSFTPAANFHGTTSFTYSGKNQQGANITGTITVQVTPVNDPPVAVDDAANTTAPNPVVIQMLGNDSDVDGDALTVTAVTTPTNGSAAITGAGKTLTYTPAAGATGQAQFSYTVSDGHSGTATATVRVTVAPPPVNGQVWETQQDTPYSSALLATAGGTCVSQPQVLSVTQPANGSVTIVRENVGRGCPIQTNKARFVPAKGFIGVTSFTFTGTSFPGGPVISGLVTVRVNGKPIAVNDQADIVAGLPVVIPVLANDSDPEGDPLRVTEARAWTPRGSDQGTATISGNGQTVTYTGSPASLARVYYVIADGRGGLDTAFVELRRVTNRRPQAADDAATVGAGRSVFIPVLANDSDPDGDALSIAGITGLGRGSATIQSAGVVYTPPATFVGTATFRYTVSDGKGGTAAATVRVTVTPESDMLIQVDQAATAPRIRQFPSTFTVRNGGPSRATNVVVVIRWSELFFKANIYSLNPACRQPRIDVWELVCTWPAIAPNGSRTATVVTGGIGVGAINPMTITYTVSAAETDPNPANNSASASTTFQ